MMAGISRYFNYAIRGLLMKRTNYFSFLALFIATSVLFAGCSGCSTEEADGGDAYEMDAAKDMEKMDVADESHDGEMAEVPGELAMAATHDEGGEEGEESGDMIGRFEELDQTRGNAHLTLRYNEEANTFYGTLMNMSTATLENVRIEVHLSNGREIGPTSPVNLVNGQTMDITLEGPEEPFVEWTAQVEVGEGED